MQSQIIVASCSSESNVVAWCVSRREQTVGCGALAILFCAATHCAFCATHLLARQGSRDRRAGRAVQGQLQRARPPLPLRRRLPRRRAEQQGRAPRLDVAQGLLFSVVCFVCLRHARVCVFDCACARVSLAAAAAAAQGRAARLAA